MSADAGDAAAVGRDLPGLEARATSAVVGLAASATLAVAAWLEPNGAGHGTHTALGLPPCTFYVLTGLPCPMCGATTTFALLADGALLDGVLNQPFAALLFFATVGVAAVGVAEAVHPVGRWRRLSRAVAPYEGRIAAALGLTMIAAWTYKIIVMR